VTTTGRACGLGLLRTSSSIATLLVGGATTAFAACANGAGSDSGFDNPLNATTPCVARTSSR
jgi:hypothetical protein